MKANRSSYRKEMRKHQNVPDSYGLLQEGDRRRNPLQLINFRYIQFGQQTLTAVSVRFSHSVVNDNEPVHGHTGTSKSAYTKLSVSLNLF
jgi:hypothetical protein